MPITWNAENESKLMANIFLVCDIKVSQAELKQVAERMGNDCTPKAITHRLQKLRNAGKTEAAKDNDEPKTKKAKTTPAVKKTPRQTAKKRASTPIDSDASETPALPTPMSSKMYRPQRTAGVKRNYEEVDVKEEIVDGEFDKNVVEDGITVGEDIGEGFRATRPDYTSPEESESELSEEEDSEL